MTPSEQKDLQKIIERLRHNVAQAKVLNRTANNVYSWGLADGLESAYDVIVAFRDKWIREGREEEKREGR